MRSVEGRGWPSRTPWTVVGSGRTLSLPDSRLSRTVGPPLPDHSEPFDFQDGVHLESFYFFTVESLSSPERIRRTGPSPVREH